MILELYRDHPGEDGKVLLNYLNPAPHLLLDTRCGERGFWFYVLHDFKVRWHVARMKELSKDDSPTERQPLGAEKLLQDRMNDLTDDDFIQFLIEHGWTRVDVPIDFEFNILDL